MCANEERDSSQAYAMEVDDFINSLADTFNCYNPVAFFLIKGLTIYRLVFLNYFCPLSKLTNAGDDNS